MVMGAIAKDVIFRIGSSGTSGTIAKFTKLAAKLAIVGVAVKIAADKISEMVVRAEALQQVTQNLQIDMSKFNKDTAGLIDTFESLQGAMSLQVAGIKLTKEEMAALGVAAVTLNKSLGNGPEGTGGTFKALVTSVIKGNERGLLPLGITLSQTTDKAAASREAIEKLTERFGHLSVSAETAQEKLFAIDNSLGTIQDLQTAAFINELTIGFESLFTEIGGGTDTLFEFEQLMSDTNGEIGAWLISMDGLIALLDQGISSFIGWEEGINRSTHAISMQIEEMKRYTTNLRAIKALQDEINETRQKSAKETSAASGVSALEVELQNLIGTADSMDEYKKVIKTYEKLQKSIAAARKAGLNVSEESASRKAFIAELESIVAEGDEVDARLARRKLGIKEKGSGGASGPRFDSFSIRRVEIAENTADSLISIEEKRVFDMNTLYDSQLEYEENAAKESLKRQEAALKESLKRDLEAQKQNEKMKQDAVAGSMQFSRDLSSLMETESKAAFNVGKTAAIAEATVSTALGAQKAFTSLAGIPIVGPVLGGLAATAAGVAGAIRIKKIKDTKFGGGGSVSTSSGVGLPSTSVGNTASVNTGQQEEIIDRRPIQVIMDGKMITDQIITESVKRQKQGDKGLQVRA